MRLGRCTTSGHVVSTASSTPQSATRPISRREIAGEAIQRCGARRPRRDARAPRRLAGAPLAVAVSLAGSARGGVGRPVLMGYSCSGPRGSAQHT